MILRYQKVIEKFTEGSTTHALQEPDYLEDAPRCTELATVDGYTYVHVPEGVTLPDQPEQITIEEVTLTPELREQIKAASPHVRRSYERLNERVRARYSDSDEHYLNRISADSARGTYILKDGEADEIAARQAWVEECREIARQERAGWGL